MSPITRKSLFGVPPNPTLESVHTSRLVPLTQGVEPSTSWPLQPAGSAQSMTNYLPLDGVLAPRSRLSSLNTIRSLPGGINRMALRVSASGQDTEVWLTSSHSRHGLLTSNGSISVASFVSAFGFGTITSATDLLWHHTQAYFAAIDDNALIVAGGPNSADTLLCLYRNTPSGPPLCSYLTAAPKAKCVTSIDDYIVAWNITGTGNFATRAQWTQRGTPSGWTADGSGFEDLLSMRGAGRAIRATTDGRLLLFTEYEIWYGVTAAYPAQWQFAPLDQEIGCASPHTIVDCPAGILFLGTDRALRLLSKWGGPSQVIAPSLANYIRRLADRQDSAWGVYDPLTRLYILSPIAAVGFAPVVVNIDTGEWGFLQYPAGALDHPRVGLSMLMPGNSTVLGSESMLFGNSSGTVSSYNSLLANDSGSVVTSAWRSGPVASDLAGNYKTLSRIALDYRATSKSTLTVKVSQDGGNNYEAAGNLMSLTSAPISGRIELDVYRGGAFPSIELTSTSTGYELHRLDVSMDIGGRK